VKAEGVRLVLGQSSAERAEPRCNQRPAARSATERAGKGLLKVARECGVGSGTVQRIKREMKGAFVGVAA
jgi:hypothetical protein